MRKKKNLWSGVSILIVAVLVITAFIRGNAQAWLLAAAFVIWAVWATYYFLVPYIKEELHKREAKRIRKKCEKQDAAFDRFIIPEVSDPVEPRYCSPCQLSHFSLSAIGIPQRNLGVA